MPFLEVVFFLIEKVKFGNEKMIEMLVHEQSWWLVGGGKLGPIEV